MVNYVLWTRHGERGVVMEENEDEEDDNNIPDWAAGQDFADTLMEDADEEEIPEDSHVGDLGQVLKDAQRDCENDNEKAKLRHMIEDGKIGVIVPTLLVKACFRPWTFKSVSLVPKLL
jgi:hypothetical protein